MSPDAPLERSVLGKRASIIDVFENFFGDDISRLSADFVMKLPSGRGDELVHHIDEFLASEASAEFSQDAVCIDGLANPILVADDPMEPKTTRKAKQVGLMHTEVVFPIPPLALEHAISGVKHTAGDQRQLLFPSGDNYFSRTVTFSSCSPCSSSMPPGGSC